MAFTTKKSMLKRMRDNDEVSWKEFYDTYRPLIVLCGRDHNLTDDENEELVSQVMCELFNKDIIGKYSIEKIPDDVTFSYDPQRGRFRHYLKKIIHNQALKIYHRRKKLEVNMENDDASFKDKKNFDDMFEEEWQHLVLQQALVELRNHVHAQTYSAFELTALQGRPAKDVAEFLGISENSVYVARSRCIGALRDICNKLKDE